MEHAGEDARVPYGKVAAWGMVASAVVTVGFLAFSPMSPVRMAADVLERGRASMAGGPIVLEPAGGAAGVAVAEALREALDDVDPGRSSLERELRGRLRRELRRELRKDALGLQRELLQEWSGHLPGLGRDLSRSLSLELRTAISPG